MVRPPGRFRAAGVEVARDARIAQARTRPFRHGPARRLGTPAGTPARASPRRPSEHAASRPAAAPGARPAPARRARPRPAGRRRVHGLRAVRSAGTAAASATASPSGSDCSSAAPATLAPIAFALAGGSPAAATECSPRCARCGRAPLPVRGGHARARRRHARPQLRARQGRGRRGAPPTCRATAAPSGRRCSRPPTGSSRTSGWRSSSCSCCSPG